MALENTFMRLSVDTSHATFKNVPQEQLSAQIVHIGPGNVAFHPYQLDQAYQESLDAVGGYPSRMVRDHASLIIGSKNPYFMPINQLGMMNITQVNELSVLVRKGLILPTVINKGETVGDIGTEWRNGFSVDWKEVMSYFIEPRTVWENVVVAQAAPIANEDLFLYFPSYPGTQPIIEVISDDPAAIYDITVYGYNPSENVVSVIAEFLNKVGSTRCKISTDFQHQYILPIISSIDAGAPTLDVNVGFQIMRIG